MQLLKTEECFFWAIHNQAELDLLIVKNGKRYGFEFKFSDSPHLTKSMLLAFETLELTTLEIIYPGKKNYTLQPNISVQGLNRPFRPGSD